MVAEPFIRYIIRGPGNFWGWQQFVAPFLEQRKWDVKNPEDFSYESSYGFDPNVERTHMEILDVNYCLQNASAIVEYHGEPVYDSVFDPGSDRIVIDDLLAFMSLYSGVYCQYLWKERRRLVDGFSAYLAIQVNNRTHNDEWAGPHHTVPNFFEKALATIPTLDRKRFELAIRWFFSAIREFEVGRPLVEAALNWVCLESQANYLGLPGNKYEKVEALLVNQGFPTIPNLWNLYTLRNDSFHDGQLSNLNEADAQAARTAGRVLVRAQILNLLGMAHSDFRQKEFVDLYAT